MSQPKWKCVAQLGDKNPVDHGGFFVLIDTTGVHTPQVELLESPDDDEGEWMVYRFDLDRCTYIDGVLSDNPFHPTHPAWFAKPENHRAARPQDTTYLSNVCRTMDIEESELVRLLCSENPVERAQGYRCIGQYHGWDNFDSYPLTMKRGEVNRRYKKVMYRVKE